MRSRAFGMLRVGRGVLLLGVAALSARPDSYTVCAVGCSFSDLQQAINAAQPGDELVLNAGEVFTGNFTLPPKTSGDNYITIRSSGLDSLPPDGYRVGPGNAPQMATIVTPNSAAALTIAATQYRIVSEDVGAGTLTFSAPHNFQVGDPVLFWQYGGQWANLAPPLVPDTQVYWVIGVPAASSIQISRTPSGPPVQFTAPGSGYDRYAFKAIGSSGYRIIGLEIRPANGVNAYALVTIGNGYEGVLDAFPHHIEILRNYIHGNANQHGPTRCVAANGAYLTFRDNYIDECHEYGPDTQAIACWNCPGPMLVQNNYLAGAGENVLIGGSGPAMPGLLNGQQGGMSFIGNYFKKPLKWKYNFGTNPPVPPCASEDTGGEYYEMVRQIASADKTTDVITTTVPHGYSAGQAVRVTGGYWWPGFDVGGLATYYVKSAPTATTLTLSATPGGSTQHVGDNISGSTYLVANNAIYTCVNGAWTPTTTPQLRYTFKNLFELKNATGVLADGNIFENSWVDAQGGGTFQGAQVDVWARWSTVQDVTYQNSISRHSAEGAPFGSFNVGGLTAFDTPFSQFVFRNMLIYDVGNTLYDSAVGDLSVAGRGLILGAIPNTTLDHVTIIGKSIGVLEYSAAGYMAGLSITNSVIAPGMGSDGQAPGCTGFNYYAGAGNYTLSNLLLVGNAQQYGTAAQYADCSSGMNFVPNEAAVPFVDPANGNYRLDPSSAYAGISNDGTDPGTDFDALENATSGVTGGSPTWSGQAGLMPSSVGSRSAVLSYQAPDNAACRLYLSTSPNYRPLHDDTAAPAYQLDSRDGSLAAGSSRQFVLGSNAPLTPGTIHYFKLVCDKRVMPGSFVTTAADGTDAVTRAVELHPPAELGAATAVVDYGTSAALGATTDPVDCSSSCVISYPANPQSVTYWRYRYLDAQGAEISSSRTIVTALP